MTSNLAVDITKTLCLDVIDLRQTDCTKVVEKLVSREETNGMHLKFLLVKTKNLSGSGIIASNISCQLPTISCSSILHKKDLDSTTLQTFLNMGVSLTSEDLETAVRIFPDEHVDIIKVVNSACVNQSLTVDYESLCRIALDERKPLFTAHLISHGAKPDSSLVNKLIDWKNMNEVLYSYVADKSTGSERNELVYKAIKQSNFELATLVLKSGPLDCEQVDLGSWILSTSLATSPELFQQLLEAGVNPNGTSGCADRPLDAVLSLKHYQGERKVPLIFMLVKAGADVDRVCTPRQEGTTIVHKVTELALETGNKRLEEGFFIACT